MFFSDVLSRVQDQPVAAGVTIGLVVLQLALAVYLCSRTLLQLWRFTKTCRAVADAVRRHSLRAGLGALRNVKDDLAGLHDVLALLADYERHPKRYHPAPDPKEALTSVAALPRHYNARLDAAAPGLFTACGIVGTFFGLVIGFWKIDPSAASEGVGSLIGGMGIAFINSLVGILISIGWTISSRVVRHRFDSSVSDVRRAAADRLRRASADRRLYVAVRQVERGTLSVRRSVRALDLRLAALEQGSDHLADTLGEKLDQLRETTSDSSRELASTLAPQLEESLGRLVAAPFENLVNAVQRFESGLATASERQLALIEGAQEAARVLSEAQTHLAGSAESIKTHFGEFAASAVLLREQVATTERLVATSQTVTADLERVRSALSEGVAQIAPLLSGLEATREAVVTTSDALAVNADVFRSASERLDSAVEGLSGAARKAVAESMDNVREDLERAITSMVERMAETGRMTVGAYEDASLRVTEAIDATMSDLAERIRAELATLAGQLPAEMAKLHEASAVIRRSIKDATASLDSAVGQLANQSSQVLKRHLDDYEQAVAKAVNHFSGTLGLWEDRVEDLEKAAKALTGAANRLEAGREPVPVR